MDEPQPRYFEDIKVGDTIPPREHGPFTIVESVRWLGFQENWSRTHMDRQHVQETRGLKSFICSGAYRESLIARMITDWVGPEGMLRKLNLRQSLPTLEGDMMRFSGTVVEVSPAAGDPWVTCELQGTNQDDRQIVTGRCTVEIRSRATS